MVLKVLSSLHRALSITQSAGGLTRAEGQDRTQESEHNAICRRRAEDQDRIEGSEHTVICRRTDEGGGPGPHRVPGAGAQCGAGAAVEGGQQRQHLGQRRGLQGRPRRVHQRCLLLRERHCEPPTLHFLFRMLARKGMCNMLVHAQCNVWATCTRPAHHALSSMVGRPSDSSRRILHLAGSPCCLLSQGIA